MATLHPIEIEELESTKIMDAGMTVELLVKTTSNDIPLRFPIAILKRFLENIKPILAEAAQIQHTPRNFPQVLFPKDWRVDSDSRIGAVSLTYLQPGDTEITLVFPLSDGCSLRDALAAQIDRATPPPQ